MSKGGNEAGEIILVAFRQIGCAISDEIVSIGELTPDHLIEVVARSIRLITDGDAKYPVKLPQGMASRHRLCTDMANKIKAMGYSGDCGYNQLLYPAEATTRPILGFLVEKLPRSEGDKQEEILGADALLNRRIMASITDWSKDSFVRACCPDFSPGRRRVFEPRFHARPFLTHPLDPASPTPLTSQVPVGQDVAPSVLERNATQSLAEATLEAQLSGDDRGGVSGEGVGEAGNGEDSAAAQSKVATAKRVLREALTQSGGGGGGEEQGTGGDNDGGDGGGGGGGSSGGVGGGSQKKATLADLLRELSEEAANTGEGGAGGEKKGTRFTHATEFGQEEASSAGSGGVAASSPAAAVAAAAAAGGEGEAAAAAAAAAAAMAALSPLEAQKLKAEAEQRARAEELASLEGGLVALEAQLAGGSRDVGLLRDKTRQLGADLLASEASGVALERDVLIRTKTLEMLPQAAQHTAQLEAICKASAGRLVDLGREWEKHRVPLVHDLRSKKQAQVSKKAKARGMVEEMKRARVEMQAMAHEVRDKEEQAALLAEEIGKMPKNVNRSLYTYRILDIIQSIAKQKKEIEKIILEVKTVQKDINAVGERLSRAEALADEKIFSTAKLEANKKDVAMVACYRHLSDLRSRFDDLVQCISDTGKRENDARGLEAKTEQLAERVSKNNTERILADLAQVQDENAGLVAQLRALKAKQQAASAGV